MKKIFMLLLIGIQIIQFLIKQYNLLFINYK